MRPVQATTAWVLVEQTAWVLVEQTAWVLVVQAKASSPLKIEAQNILV